MWCAAVSGPPRAARRSYAPPSSSPCSAASRYPHQSPLTTHHSPPTHHSPLTPHHSPLATRHSPLAARHSPLTTHPSPLTPRHSPLTTRHPTFTLTLTPDALTMQVGCMGVWLLGCGGVASLTLFGSGDSQAESQARSGGAARGGEATAGRTSSFFTALRPAHCTPRPQPGRQGGHRVPLDATSPRTSSPDATSPDVTTSGSSSGGGSGSGSSGGSGGGSGGGGGGGDAAARVLSPSVLAPLPPSVAALHASFASPAAPATRFVQATPLAHQRRGHPGQPQASHTGQPGRRAT